MKNPFDKAAFQNGAVPVKPDFLESMGSCLVLAPHPDDESLGCGGLIKLLREKNCRVTVVVTTDGSQSHPNSLKYPEAERIELRKQELISALEILGVSADNIHFLDGKDAMLPHRHEVGFSVFKERLKQIISTVSPQLCLVPYELDPHCDHRATWQLLNAALGEVNDNGITVWEYPIWLYELAGNGDIPKVEKNEVKYVDVSAYLAQKKAAIAAHASQVTRLIDDDPSGFILTGEMIENFLNGKEYFLERNAQKKERTLHADYFQSLYGANRDPWNFETSEYEQKKYQTTIEYLPEEQYTSGLEIGCSIGVLTNMLRQKCKSLLSIDISEIALSIARERLKDYPEVTFQLGAIPDDFPEARFDLIVMSEVGYYLSIPDLLRAKEKILNGLLPEGTLILVHWTHYVVDYPLTGEQVHQTFLNDARLTSLSSTKTDDYMLNVFTHA